MIFFSFILFIKLTSKLCSFPYRSLKYFLIIIIQAESLVQGGHKKTTPMYEILVA